MNPAGPGLVFIHSSDELYGADRMLLEQVAALPAGVRCEVWLPTDAPHPERALCTELVRRSVDVRHVDLPVLRRAYRTPRKVAALAARVLRLHAQLRRAAPDIVYCTTSAGFLAAPVARLAGVPRVIGHVQEIWSGFDRRVLTAPTKACHQLLVISEPVAVALPPRLRRRVTVVPNGTPEPDDWEPLDGRTGPLTYVVASRWNGWKGHRTLLEAWDRQEEGRLIVLGGPPPSGDATDVAALIGRLRRPESVELVGEVTDPSEYLSAADVAVVPSDRPEPFGLVAIEAFARGRPVIASAGGGLSDIVTDEHDGWLFPPRDAGSLARVMHRLTRSAVRNAGRRARATYEARYSIARYRERWRAAIST